jgi:hypothetical protein
MLKKTARESIMPVGVSRRRAMLDLFAAKSSHPLAQEAERQRMFGTLAATDALTALDQARDWLRSLADESGMSFPLRAALVRQVDNVAQRPARIVEREYLAVAHVPSDGATRLWRAARGYWAQLAATCNTCLGEFSQSDERPEAHRVELTLFTVRHIRAYATRLKWDQFRYWPPSDSLWQAVGRAYLYALDNGFARREVSAYPGERRQTTAEREYLRALVSQVSSMDSLLPLEIEIADRLIVHYLPAFALDSTPQTDFRYWVDAGQRRPPSRLDRRPEPGPSTFYFDTGNASVALRGLRQQLEWGTLPSGIDLARYRSPRVILPVVRHLESYWASEPRRRTHDRYRVHSRLTVVSGLGDLLACLQADTDPAQAASWVVDNVSQSGMRVQLALEPDATVRIGTLLGIRPEGGDNWLVGVVRRFIRTDETAAAVGVETLSKWPIPAAIDGDAAQHVLLLDPIEDGETVRIVASGVDYVPGRTLTCRALGAAFSLDPVEPIERGVEFDLARYRVAIQH